MSASFRYISDYPAWDVPVDTVKPDSISLVEFADHGAVGMGSVVVSDGNADAGYASNTFAGHKRFKAIQSASSDTTLFSGYITSRRYTRDEAYKDGSIVDGSARLIDLSLADLNAIPGFRVVTSSDGNRPSETVGTRLRWLLASSFMSGIRDIGYVDYPTDTMDANDYRGQTAADVLLDCANAVATNAPNFFVYYDASIDGPALWFRDSNGSTSWSSSISISNTLSEVNDTTVFAPLVDATLERTPEHVYSGVFLPYTNGYVYQTRPATASNFAARDGVAPNANVKTAATATAIATRFLSENKTEDDHIAVTIVLPAASVNLVRAGMRMQVKFSHLPGYTTATWCRVIKRTLSQFADQPNAYKVALELSPQETFVPSIVQTVYGEQDSQPLDLDFTSPVVPGDLLILAFGRRNSGGTDVPTTISPYLQSNLGPTGERPFTQFTGAGGRTRASDIAGVDYCGLYYRVASGDEQHLRFSTQKEFVTVWDVRGADASTASILSAEYQTGLIHNLGTFSSAGSLQFMVLIIDHSDGTATTSTPGTGWTEDLDTNQGPFDDGHPEFVSMHGSTAVAATATGSITSEWAAAAVALS